MSDKKTILGYPIKDVVDATEKMALRTQHTQKHVYHTNYIFNVLWPQAAADHAWDTIMETISQTQQFLKENEKHFPNYLLHMDQWTSLLDVATCRQCMNNRDTVCTFKVCPRKIVD